MKRVIIGFIAGVICATAGTAAASSAIQKITASVRTDYSVELDGQKVDLNNDPLAYNGSSYLPVKELSELLGNEVGFENGVIKISTPAEKLERREAFLFDIPISEMNKEQVEMEISMAESRIKINNMSLNNPNVTENEKEVLRQQNEEAEQILTKLEARYAELTAAE